MPDSRTGAAAAAPGFVASPAKDAAGKIIHGRIARPSEGRFVNIGKLAVPVYVLAFGPATGQACRWTAEETSCDALG